jgi:hypothetical protein
MSGVTYTNSEYSVLLRKINAKVKKLGNRGAARDFAWNMVAWSSFTSINTDSGSLKFYLAGDPGIIFAKDIVAIGFASNVSDSSPCHQDILTSINALDRTITVQIDLGCTSPPCTSNPCPKILAPQAMGYNTETAATKYLTMTLDFASINTALAVNMGIVPIANLVDYPGDNSRISLLSQIVRSGGLNSSTASNTSSYYGK